MIPFKSFVQDTLHCLQQETQQEAHINNVEVLKDYILDRYFCNIEVTYEAHKWDEYIFVEKIPVFDSKTLQPFTATLTVVCKGLLTYFNFRRKSYVQYTVKELKRMFREVEVTITKDELGDTDRVCLR